MIAHIQGKIVEKCPTDVVIDCNGVGYFLNISLHTFSQIGDAENFKLYTHLAIREDAHTLYGFADKEERTVFRHLISVSGVGASTARMILSALTPAELQSAILEDNVALLKGVKGIGAKSAQRIIVDLKDKIGKEELSTQISAVGGNTNNNEALSALTSLGFNKVSVQKVLKKINENNTINSVEDLIKEALKQL